MHGPDDARGRGADTPGKVAALCSKAVRPDPTDGHIPSVVAVCVYPNLVPVAVERLRGSGVKVACATPCARHVPRSRSGPA